MTLAKDDISQGHLAKEQVCQGTLYGPWIRGTLMGIGFELHNDLTVFAAQDDMFLKMVGVKGNGDQEGRYKTKPEGDITLQNVKQAWESPTGYSGGLNYQVKDMSSFCSTGNLKAVDNIDNGI